VKTSSLAILVRFRLSYQQLQNGVQWKCIYYHSI